VARPVLVAIDILFNIEKFMHKIYLKAIFFISFICTSCASYPVMAADVLRTSLDNYCNSKEQNALQSTNIFLPEREKNPEIKWDDLDAEALADAYIKSKTPTKVIVECSQLVSLSKEDIQLGFHNKPKHPFDFYLDEEWAGFFERYPGVKGLVKVSQPGFSKNQNYAVVYIVSQCAPLCGYANIFQYKNVDGKWIWDKTVFVSKS